MSAARRVAVLPAGSWGTTFSKVVADAGADVVLWTRRRELAATIQERRENPDYLPGLRLPDGVRATHDVREALSDAEFVVIAVPSQTLRQNLVSWRPHLPRAATFVSLMKGIELGTAKRMSEVIAEVVGVDTHQVAVVSGPNLAHEIAQEQPSATVVACSDHDRAVTVQQACHTAYLRPYTNTDVVGCELGGAIKNVIALAVGIVGGMGFGDNTRASLITRGLTEMARLGVSLGAEPGTFAGLAGLGDLVATCSSPLSRNRTFGERLGRGQTLRQVLDETRQIAEGVKTCRSVLDLGRRAGVDMPITEAVVQICHEGASAASIVRAMMARQAKAE
ncbi:MAG: NAD(P)-dependent glycerol-3-phosphate dehydrogenase [Geodermatophilaceae bacterium]|nr:NAD(P)-dependent glycerol-3-phosphate dehydrogenase [Geodermatophilaceae bacterium]